MSEHTDDFSDKLPGAEQPLLPGILEGESLGAELLEPVEAQKARYSGKIVEKNQERIAMILAARSMGIPIRTICRSYAVSAHTLAEIERRHASKLATLKDRCARKFGAFVELGLDRALREVDQMDRDKLMIAIGIAAEKLQLLSGEPTVIIGDADARRFSVDTLRARLARDVIDVTGSGAGESSQMGGAALPPSASEGST